MQFNTTPHTALDRILGVVIGIAAFVGTFFLLSWLTACAPTASTPTEPVAAPAATQTCDAAVRGVLAAEQAAGRVPQVQQFRDAVVVGGVDVRAGTAHVTAFPTTAEAQAAMQGAGWDDAGQCVLPAPSGATIHYYSHTLPLDMGADKRGPV